MKKAEEAAREIRKRSGNHDVLCRRLDLSSLKSVRQFAEKFKQDNHRLDILINNAGRYYAFNVQGSAQSKEKDIYKLNIAMIAYNMFSIHAA